VQPLLAILCVVLLPAAGCSGRDEEARSALTVFQRGAAVQQVEEGAEQTSCLHFRRLQAFLPHAPEGFRPLRATASTGRYGEVSVSEAEQVFVSGEAQAAAQADAGPEGPGVRQLSVRIVDTSLASRIAEAVRTAAREAQETHDKQAALGGYARTAPLLFDRAVGYVSHNPDDGGRVEAMLLVGERFLVAVTGHGFGSNAEAKALLAEIDLTGLSQLARPSIALRQEKGAPW
jgi:hypothetical protein